MCLCKTVYVGECVGVFFGVCGNLCIHKMCVNESEHVCEHVYMWGRGRLALRGVSLESINRCTIPAEGLTRGEWDNRAAVAAEGLR